MNRQFPRPALTVAPPGPDALVPWTKMGKRELAFGCLLALKQVPIFGPRWRLSQVDFQYDPASDVVVVSQPGIGETWAMVRGTLTEVMEEVVRRWGQDSTATYLTKQIVELAPA